MAYYDPQETVITVTQHWRVRVAASRYFKQAMVEIKEKLQPERKCFWKASHRQYNGYQADLVAFTIDSAPEPLYPDW